MIVFASWKELKIKELWKESRATTQTMAMKVEEKCEMSEAEAAGREGDAKGSRAGTPTGSAAASDGWVLSVHLVRNQRWHDFRDLRHARLVTDLNPPPTISVKFNNRLIHWVGVQGIKARFKARQGQDKSWTQTTCKRSSAVFNCQRSALTAVHTQAFLAKPQ